MIRTLVQAYAKEEIIVLDFFAGSGTTGHAMQDINKNCGNKKVNFILVQAPEILDSQSNKPEIINAIKICDKYHVSRNIAQITTERLRRVMYGQSLDGSKDYEWLKNNSLLGGSLDVYEIATVSNSEHVCGKTPFDVIDETLYGKEKFTTIEEKVKWVCENFEITQNSIESDKDWKKRVEEQRCYKK